MYIMRILLFADRIGDARAINKALNQGNATAWGWIGWLFLLAVFFIIYIFIRDSRKQKQKLESYYSEKKELDEKYRDVNYEISRKEKLIREIKKLNHKKKEKEKINIEKNELTGMFEERDELFLQLKQCESKIKELESDIKKKKNEDAEHKIRRIIGAAIICFVFALNFNNMIAAAQEAGQTISGLWNEEENLQQESPEEQHIEKTVSEENEKEEVEVESQYVESPSSIENGERENPDYNFIIENAHLNNTLDDTVTDIIFLSDNVMDDEGYTQFIADCKQGKITETLQKEYGGKLGIKGLLTEIADEYENSFLKKLEEGKTIQTQAEWERSGPRSTELSKLIDERRCALWLEESVPFRRGIYWGLANDYQRFGDECFLQGKDGTQIYYYYGMSIYCCYCALGYAGTGDDNSDETILNYIKGRYKDIMDNEAKGIPKDVVRDAEKMYFFMENSRF